MKAITESVDAFLLASATPLRNEARRADRYQIWWDAPDWLPIGDRPAWFAACREVGELDGTADSVPLDYFTFRYAIAEIEHHLRVSKIRCRELSLCE